MNITFLLKKISKKSLFFYMFSVYFFCSCYLRNDKGIINYSNRYEQLYIKAVNELLETGSLKKINKKFFKVFGKDKKFRKFLIERLKKEPNANIRWSFYCIFWILKLKPTFDEIERMLNDRYYCIRYIGTTYLFNNYSYNAIPEKILSKLKYMVNHDENYYVRKNIQRYFRQIKRHAN